MKNLLYCSIIFLSYVTSAYAQMGPGTTCPSTAPCYVIMSGGGGGPVTANQGTQAASSAGSTWFVQEYLAGSAVSLTNPMPVTPGTGSVFPVSGTVAATQSGTWNINSVTTLPSITVSSSVLPTGASTATNQTSVQSSPGTPQTTAETIQGNASGIPVPVSASSLPLPSGAATSANQTNVQSSPGTPQTTALTVQGNAGGVALPVSAASLPLPSGASTAANQTNVQSAPGTPQTTALTIQGNASGVSVPITGALPSLDVTSTGNTINSATPNATYSIALANARCHTKFSITGLTASGATLTVEQSVDGGTTWVAAPSLSQSLGISTTLTTDGIYSVDTAGSTNVRLRVSTTGAGTITVSSNASSADGITLVSNSIQNPANTQIIQGGSAISSSNGIYSRSQGFTSTSFSGNTSGSINTFTSVLAANSARNGCSIQNTGTKVEYVYFGANASATTTNSIQLAGGQSVNCSSGEIVLTDNISMASGTATQPYVGFSQ